MRLLHEYLAEQILDNYDVSCQVNLIQIDHQELADLIRDSISDWDNMKVDLGEMP